MSLSAARFGRGALIALGASCEIWAHFALRDDSVGPLRLVLLLLPPLLLASWLAVRSVNRQLWWLVLLAAAGAGLLLVQLQKLGLAAAYGLPHAAAYVFMFWLFGRTLAPGREPLITRLARRVHGTLSAPMEAYTRHATQAWCGFFVAQIAVSGLLFVYTPLHVWSLFVNVLNFPLLGLMFVGEYLYRVTVHRDFPQATIAEAIAAFADDRSR
jgi:uncharacterized membrane protein